MPFRLVQSGSSAALWQTCADRFLDELGDNRGPSGFESHLWITHRSLRDLLFERAYEAGHAGVARPAGLGFFPSCRNSSIFGSSPLGCSLAGDWSAGSLPTAAERF